jgi:hypothetical protein
MQYDCIHFFYLEKLVVYALSITFGAAERISSFALSAYLAKLFMNSFASSLAFLS